MIAFAASLIVILLFVATWRRIAEQKQIRRYHRHPFIYRRYDGQ